MPNTHDSHVLLITSVYLDGRAPMLDPAVPVPVHHILQAAGAGGHLPEDVRSQLAELGYQVPTSGELAAVPDDAMKLVSYDLDGASPWIKTHFAPRMRAYILWAAAQLERPPVELAAAYVALGFPVRDPERFPASVDEVDEDALVLVSDRLSGEWPWYEETEPATLRGRILWAAARLEEPPAEIAARYARLGYRTPGLGSPPERVSRRDRLLASDYVDGRAPWLGDDAVVPLSQILTIVDRAEDDTKETEETAARAVRACRDLTGLGYRVEPGVAEVTADDLVLISQEMNGAPPWLDQDEPVPVGHVLCFAQKHGRNPNALVIRLSRLGYRHLPKGSLADHVDADALALAGYTRTTWEGDKQAWLEQDGPGWFPHVLKTAARTGIPPAEVMDRLRALGYRIPEVTLPSTVSAEDVRLVNRSFDDDNGQWLDLTGPVPTTHVLRAAHARGVPVSAVLSRLAELGCARLPAVPDRTVTEDDLQLISTDGQASYNWLEDTVPYGRVLHACATTGRSVHEIADRYRELGYTDIVLPDTALSVSVSEDDLLLFRLGTDEWVPHWPGVDEEIPLGHILLRASIEAVAPAEIGRRLRALGFRNLPAALPDTPFPGDPVLVSQNRRPTGPWLDPADTVSTDHIWGASRELGVSAYDVADRLLALGYTLPFTLRAEDRLILSLNADGSAPWLGASGLGHTLLAAKVLGRTPAEIITRKTVLGFPRHDLPEPAGFDAEDILVLSEGLDSRAPWLDRDTTPTLLHVLRAARATGRSPQETAVRLARLGHEVTLPVSVRLDDIPLLEALGRNGRDLEIAHVLGIASSTGRSPAEVAASLTALGYAVPDAAFPTARPVTPRA
ncbi:wHTH domain-containing protein [Streptomyces prasinus]